MVDALLQKGSFPVHSYEVDATGVLAPAALVGYLIEVAGVHATHLGCGIDSMFERGFTWVLSRMRVAIERPVVVGEVLSLETWPSGTERLFALRDFRVTDAHGTIVAKATSQWLVLSLETRRAVWPDEAIGPGFREAGARVFEEPFIKLPPLASADQERRFDTRYQDIDRNLHVTSTSYVAWALEAIPLETWRSSRLTFLEVHYMNECHHPSTVLSRAKNVAEGRFQHAVVREADGVDVARLTTQWAVRE